MARKPMMKSAPGIHKAAVEEPTEDLPEEDDFEITFYQPMKIVEEHAAYKDAISPPKRNLS